MERKLFCNFLNELLWQKNILCETLENAESYGWIFIYRKEFIHSIISDWRRIANAESDGRMNSKLHLIVILQSKSFTWNLK